MRRLWNELATGCLLGRGCSIVIALGALAWLGEGRVALRLLGEFFAGVVISAFLGFVVPAALRQLGKQPQIAAGPIALAVSDLLSLLLYLSLAHGLLV